MMREKSEKWRIPPECSIWYLRHSYIIVVTYVRMLNAGESLHLLAHSHNSAIFESLGLHHVLEGLCLVSSLGQRIKAYQSLTASAG